MKILKIENSKVLLEIRLNGGSYINFQLKSLPLNPINWCTKDPNQPPFKGHFLCFDRWGPPTDAERVNGFRHHGEANLQIWKLLPEQQKLNRLKELSLFCNLPMGGLQLTRKVELSEDEPVFFVEEEIKNLNKYGRMYNIVQHVTIAPPFLDKSTLFDTNAEKGFENKMDGSFDQEENVMTWPEVDCRGEKINLRQFKHNWPLVSSFVYRKNDKYGWITTCNPNKGLLLGYLWRIEDYPWINFWRSMENDEPVAFGMEFGTTGLHEPFPVVAKKGKIFDQNIYDFIDANEVVRKSFTAFLAKIPQNYSGVDRIEINNSFFVIKEKKGNCNDIKYLMK